VIRRSQAELRRLGCYRGEANGYLDDATRDALKQVYVGRGTTDVALEIDETVLSKLKTLEAPTCPSQPRVDTRRTNPVPDYVGVIGPHFF